MKAICGWLVIELSKCAAHSFLVNSNNEAIQFTVDSESENALSRLSYQQKSRRNAEHNSLMATYKQSRYLNFHSCYSSATKQGFIMSGNIMLYTRLSKTEMKRAYSELLNNSYPKIIRRPCKNQCQKPRAIGKELDIKSLQFLRNKYFKSDQKNAQLGRYPSSVHLYKRHPKKQQDYSPSCPRNRTPCGLRQSWDSV